MSFDHYNRTSNNDQGDESVVPGAVPSGGGDVGPLMMIRKAFTVGVGNSTDDVTVCTTRMKARIVDWMLVTTTQVASKYFKLYPATGGGSGTQILDTLTTAGNTTPARYRSANAAASAALASGTTIYLRREDNVQAGEICIWLQPEQ